MQVDQSFHILSESWQNVVIVDIRTSMFSNCDFVALHFLSATATPDLFVIGCVYSNEGRNAMPLDENSPVILERKRGIDP